jgi:hypothetical protein
MFMRVNSTCAHQVRPPVNGDQGDGLALTGRLIGAAWQTRRRPSNQTRVGELEVSGLSSSPGLPAPLQWARAKDVGHYRG